VARRFLHPGAKVLDLGCADGALFKQIAEVSGIGLDPLLTNPLQLPNAKLIPGRFPGDIPDGLDFDAVTMLAVLEHLPRAVQEELGRNCERVLKPKGRVIITVPSPRTDALLALLKTLRVIHGMSLEEHYGYDVNETPQLFSSFKMIARKQFQLGFNNLFVFEKQ
jgi:SAM-dependent methyltransferase